eukprot:8817178-Alexandrium_andersonii.AAC.1
MVAAPPERPGRLVGPERLCGRSKEVCGTESGPPVGRLKSALTHHRPNLPLPVWPLSFCLPRLLPGGLPLLPVIAPSWSPT